VWHKACQGDRLDAGVALHRAPDVTDSGNNCYRIPNYADFMIAYSTVPGISDHTSSNASFNTSFKSLWNVN
jgi:hypothetical protein